MRSAFAALSPLSKRAFALLLDLYTSFIGFGYLVGFATGVVDEENISLSPTGAAVTFALMLGYFAFFAWMGATPWQRVLGTRDETSKA